MQDRSISNVYFFGSLEDGFKVYPHSNISYSRYSHFDNTAEKNYKLQIIKNNDTVTYTFVRYGLFTARNGRAGSCFGLSIVFNRKYFKNIKTFISKICFQIFEAIIAEGILLSKNSENAVSFVAFDLISVKTILDEWRAKIENVLDEKYSTFLSDSKDLTNFEGNEIECINDSSPNAIILEKIKKKGAIYLSPDFYLPPKKGLGLLDEEKKSFEEKTTRDKEGSDSQMFLIGQLRAENEKLNAENKRLQLENIQLSQTNGDKKKKNQKETLPKKPSHTDDLKPPKIFNRLSIIFNQHWQWIFGISVITLGLVLFKSISRLDVENNQQPITIHRYDSIVKIQSNGVFQQPLVNKSRSYEIADTNGIAEKNEYFKSEIKKSELYFNKKQYKRETSEAIISQLRSIYSTQVPGTGNLKNQVEPTLKIMLDYFATEETKKSQTSYDSSTLNSIKKAGSLKRKLKFFDQFRQKK